MAASDRFALSAAGRTYTGAGLDQEEESAWNGAFMFVQMADTQFGMFSGNGTAATGWAEEAALAAKAVQHINRLKPKFVVVCVGINPIVTFKREKSY
jgi:hypothetical protein